MSWEVLVPPTTAPGELVLRVNGRSVATGQSAGAAGYRVEGPEGVAFCADMDGAVGYLKQLGARLSPA